VLRRFFLISWTCSGKSTIRGIRVTLPTKIVTIQHLAPSNSR
jgi:hypothetical protein